MLKGGREGGTEGGREGRREEEEEELHPTKHTVRCCQLSPYELTSLVRLRSKDASTSGIRAAYRKLAVQLHPDKGPLLSPRTMRSVFTSFQRQTCFFRKNYSTQGFRLARW